MNKPMKFTIHHNPVKKALSIPYAALQISGLNEVETLALYAVGGCTLVTHNELNATEMVGTLYLLSELCKKIVCQLAEVTCSVAKQTGCGCDSCEDECDGLSIPGCLLDAAGIAPDAPLDYAVEEGKLILFAGEEGSRSTDPMEPYGEAFCAMLSCAGVQMHTLCRMLQADAEAAHE